MPGLEQAVKAQDVGRVGEARARLTSSYISVRWLMLGKKERRSEKAMCLNSL